MVLEKLYWHVEKNVDLDHNLYTSELKIDRIILIVKYKTMELLENGVQETLDDLKLTLTF